MPMLYAVTVEWKRKDENKDVMHRTVVNVAAETADIAAKAAVKSEREGFCEQLSFCRLGQIVLKDSIDLVVE